MRRSIVVAVIFSAGFLARGLWTGPAVQADGNGRGAADPINGDVNGDGKLDVSDGIYIINYVFRGGPLPVPISCPPTGLPATGQTKCYDFVEGQGYTEVPCDQPACLGQDGQYPAGCPSDGRFVDNGDGTVTDSCTGLMWQKNAADANGDGRIWSEDLLNWQGALKYCDGLSFAGHNDWRLPNVRELESILDYGRYDLAIDPVFEAVNTDVYWSSSSVVRLPDAAWAVGFAEVAVAADNKSSAYLVRAVRNAD